MSLGYVLVSAAGNETDKAALRLALALGRRFDAHVEALHGKADPRESLTVIGPGVGGTLLQDILIATEEDIAARVRSAERVFEELAGSVTKKPNGQGGFGATLRIVEGRHAIVMAKRGRLADLTVAARQSDSDDVDQILTVESLLFESGRPVLVVPPGDVAHDLRCVAIAWDGSVEASRAVHGAMPLLEAADKVVVLTAEEDGKSMAAPEDLTILLDGHGIAVTSRTLAQAGGPVSIALLTATADEGCGVMVMGGYGHSRLREMVLGGATRDVLAATALPVLMVH